MTGHTTNKAFDRYLQLEGDTMKELYRRQKNLVDFDNPVTTKTRGAESVKASICNRLNGRDDWI